MPLVACLEIALGAFLIAEFSQRPGKAGDAPSGPASPIWWYVMYAFAGFATLAKESLGIALPGLVVFTYLVLSGDWAALKRGARILPGRCDLPGHRRALVRHAAALPRPRRRVLHLRHAAGARQRQPLLSTRCTPPRPPGRSPTSSSSWAGASSVDRAAARGPSWRWARSTGPSGIRRRRATLFFGGWAASVCHLLHPLGHQVPPLHLPVLPALAFLAALYIDKLWREGFDKHWFPIMSGLSAFVLVASGLLQVARGRGRALGAQALHTDLFVYNYTRAVSVRVRQARGVRLDLRVRRRGWCWPRCSGG